MTFNNPNHCLYCGKKLSFLHLLRNSLYCYNSHRLAHVRAQNDRLSLRFQSDLGEPPRAGFPASSSPAFTNHC
jgi:hypothetical protein